MSPAAVRRRLRTASVAIVAVVAQACGDGRPPASPPRVEAAALEGLAEGARAQIRDAYESRAEFYGLPVASDRLAFVVDASGSMRYKAAKGATRLEVALRELLAVVERLPDGTLINVVFFATHVEPWEEKLVELDGESRSSLETFIRYRRPGGLTNIYDALESATLDRRIDTVYLLTDGRPEGGATTDPYQIRLEVERWNSTGHIVIHGVSIGGDNQLVRDLASATGGRFLIPE